MPISRKYLLLAGGALAVAVGAFWFLRSRKTAKADAEYEEDEEVIVEETTAAAPETKRAAAAAPAAGAAAGSGATMTVEALRALLGDMHRQTQALLVTIAQHQQVQEQSGRGVDSEELVHLFNTHAAELRNQLFIKYGTTEDDLDAAIEAHQEDMQVVQLTMMLNQLYSAVRQNQELPEVPADMTVDKFLGKLKIFTRAVVDNLDTAIKEAQREGVRGEELQEKVSHLVMLRAKKAQEDAFTEMAMTDGMFQACLKQYQTDPRVQAVFAELHERNTRKLEALTMG